MDGYEGKRNFNIAARCDRYKVGIIALYLLQEGAHMTKSELVQELVHWYADKHIGDLPRQPTLEEAQTAIDKMGWQSSNAEEQQRLFNDLKGSASNG